MDLPSINSRLSGGGVGGGGGGGGVGIAAPPSHITDAATPGEN